MAVVAYTRVSTDKQDAGNQEFELRRYLDSNGIVADEFVTEVVSGTVKLRDRKVGQLIEKLKSGDTLIVAEISRLSRDMLTISAIIRECLDKEVTLIAVKEGWRLGADPGSKFIGIAFGMAAEIERNFISQRTKEGLAKRRADGVRLGRPVGTHRPDQRKLHGKDDQLVAFLAAHMPIAAIARYYRVNPATVRRYVQDNNLRLRALNLPDELSAETGV